MMFPFYGVCPLLDFDFHSDFAQSFTGFSCILTSVWNITFTIPTEMSLILGRKGDIMF
jgi:hypothetical protein